MYAIVEIAGQQFKVAKDQKIIVHRLSSAEGNKVTFHDVLLLDHDGKITIGAPAIDGAAVEAKVIKHFKDDKVIVFKKKRRKGYRVKNGHRQALTELMVKGIVTSGAKKAPPIEAKVEKAELKTKKQAEPEVKPKMDAPAPKKETKPIKVTPASAEGLSKMTVAELREMAKAKGISGISSMKKAELIAALS
jgi:large subunit ribosomal protein L21